MQIFIDNKFPINILQHTAAVRCLDISANRTKIAIVDENSSVNYYKTYLPKSNLSNSC